jgi:hypothetical protein
VTTARNPWFHWLKRALLALSTSPLAVFVNLAWQRWQACHAAPLGRYGVGKADGAKASPAIHPRPQANPDAT